MLGKVMKFDLKATSRFFLPMYAGLVVLTLLNKLSLEFMFDTSNRLLNTLSGIAIGFYTVGLLAVFIMTQVFIVWHFYKNLTGDEGYLMFTLPVKPSTHVNAKLLTAIIWSVSTVVLVIASFLLLASGHGVGDFFREMFTYLGDALNTKYAAEVYIICAEVIALMIISLFSSPLHYFCCIALGHLFGKHRVAGAVVSYIGIQVVLQVVSSIFMVIFGLSNVNVSINTAYDFFHYFNGYMIFSLIFSLLTTVIFYLLSTYIFTWKLNLE